MCILGKTREKQTWGHVYEDMGMLGEDFVLQLFGGHPCTCWYPPHPCSVSPINWYSIENHGEIFTLFSLGP